jgi:hypothetical protein
VSEPTTVLTDLLLAAVACVLAFRLRRSATPLPLPRTLWAAAFLLSGVAAVTGGARHALAEEAASLARRHLWSITYLVLGLANLAFLAGLVRSFVPSALRPAALFLLVVRYLVFVAVLLRVRDLGLVVADFALSLHSLLGAREGAGPWLLAGVLVSAAGALVQSLRLAPVPGLNHNDLFHLVQTGGLWLFYRAGLLLRDGDG